MVVVDEFCRFQCCLHNASEIATPSSTSEDSHQIHYTEGPPCDVNVESENQAAPENQAPDENPAAENPAADSDDENPQTKKPPLKPEAYDEYRYVLPNGDTISRHKLSLAIEVEIAVVKRLLNLEDGVKVFAHFDTTKRCGIDGDWPSLNVSLSDGTTYRLRPMYMAFEDRQNIVRYICESLDRLAAAATIVLNSS